MAATKKLIDGLTPCTEPTTEIADALTHSFLRTRRGLSGEELLPRLGQSDVLSQTIGTGSSSKPSS